MTYKELRTREIRELLGISESYASLIRNGHRETTLEQHRKLRAKIDSFYLIPAIIDKLNSVESKLNDILEQNNERAKLLNNRQVIEE